MLDRVVAFVARHAGKERPVAVRVVSLAFGLGAFVIIIPILLGLVGRLVSRVVAIAVPRNVEVLLGAAGAVVGIFFLIWSVSAFWVIGKGTPVPLASPTRLVTTGPFRYCRNPLVLGVILFYFGVGALCDQFVTGLTMLTIGLVLSTVYHKYVEEKELLVRFGGKYQEYRERTSFLIPLPPKNMQTGKKDETKT
ncbi:MAG: isoprenylcysteine carboxylmethyltransferase family protein [Candidatus Coatesbacteria bacterium]|nr:isoprenylcysteine carboxylmethyltransferase family protein [Candidatus Coatesbacteria bacterium]